MWKSIESVLIIIGCVLIPSCKDKTSIELDYSKVAVMERGNFAPSNASDNLKTFNAQYRRTLKDSLEFTTADSVFKKGDIVILTIKNKSKISRLLCDPHFKYSYDADSTQWNSFLTTYCTKVCTQPEVAGSIVKLNDLYLLGIQFVCTGNSMPDKSFTQWLHPESEMTISIKLPNISGKVQVSLISLKNGKNDTWDLYSNYAYSTVFLITE